VKLLLVCIQPVCAYVCFKLRLFSGQHESLNKREALGSCCIWAGPDLDFYSTARQCLCQHQCHALKRKEQSLRVLPGGWQPPLSDMTYHVITCRRVASPLGTACSAGVSLNCLF
jgi:hypothetical protein